MGDTVIATRASGLVHHSVADIDEGVSNPYDTSNPIPRQYQWRQKENREFSHFVLPAGSADLPSKDLYVAIKAHLVKHKEIQFVDLRGAVLGDEGLRLLAEAAESGGAQQMQSLCLSGAELGSVGFIGLLSAFTQYAPMLTRLDISGNDLGNEVAAALRAWIPPQLTHLNLSSTHLTGDGVHEILTGVAERGAVHLTYLNLCDVRLNCKATEALGGILAGCCQSSLKELRLSHCRIDDVCSDALVAGIHASSVEVLDLSNNDCIIAFAAKGSGDSAFPVSLRLLNISHNSIKQPLVAGFAASFRPCVGTLQELYMKHTADGDETLTRTLSGLGFLPELRVLDVSSCRLTYRSAKMLGQKLMTYPRLERLYLSDNLLDVEGITNLSSALERLRTLHTLHVGSCYLGNCGAVAVVSSLLRGQAPMRELDISDNAINDAGIRDICTLLSRLVCPRLNLLVLSGNPCTRLSAAHLESMMQERQTNCIVLARGTPLDSVASVSEERQSSMSGSTTTAVSSSYSEVAY